MSGDFASSAIVRYTQTHEAWRWLESGEIAERMEPMAVQWPFDDITALAAYNLLPLEPTVDGLASDPIGQQLLRSLATRVSDYRVVRGDLTPLTLTAGLMLGVAVDLRIHQAFRARTLVEDIEATQAQLDRSGGGAWWREPTHTWMAAALREGVDLVGPTLMGNEHPARIAFAVQVWQRLDWLLRCRRAGALVLSERLRTPLPPDPVAMLVALQHAMWNQPVLRIWPGLAPFWPLAPRRPLIGPALSERVQALPGAEDQLVRRLWQEIIERRRFAVDHVAVIELGERGLQQIVLCPERRIGSGSVIGFALVFDGGEAVAGELQSLPGLDEPQLFVPSLDTASDPNIGEEDLPPLPPLLGAVQQLVVACLRDLVVPRVRDEQYQQRTARRGRPTSGRRAEEREQVAVIHYLPRIVAARRAEQSAARSEGRRVTPRRYAVGVHTRRLPEGRHRSEDAEGFAREIGLPLAEHQTVVRPHWRGGTEAEKDGDEQAVRRWRSWSALDLLRTR